MPLIWPGSQGNTFPGREISPPAIHRGQVPPLQCFPAGYSAHGELQELPLPAFPSDGIVLALAGCAFPLPLAAGALKSL